MRSRTRIKPILELIEQIWELNPDLRLGQLLDNAGVNRYSEDITIAIEQLCTHYNLPFRYHALWGTRPNPSSNDVVYKKIDTLTTSHLKNILKDAHPAKNIKNAIFELLEDRGEFEEEDEVCETCMAEEYDEDDEEEYIYLSPLDGDEKKRGKWINPSKGTSNLKDDDIYIHPIDEADLLSRFHFESYKKPEGRFSKSFDKSKDKSIDSECIKELRDKLPSIEEYISLLKKSK